MLPIEYSWMRTSIRFILILISMSTISHIHATEKAWPQRGDSIYVSASFEGLEAPSLVANARMTYKMPPCKVLVIKKAKPKKLRWITKDLVGGVERLEGDWRVRMHRNEEEVSVLRTPSGA